ncbi:SDR family oxidoreductase [Micromonospora zingiberis]|uniref:SDR family oxidoreductase n=1 Tax=Micromonospora zingiberis TaxID=2053011 RepID=A0A4V2LW81_9ACTN|nr:SDR family oxidoreductase [Micromonospora zingiberis]
MFDLTGRRAVVTGGTAGIGLAIAGALADFGADVAVWGRDEGRVRAAVRRLGGRSGRPSGQVVDVADEAAVVAGMDEAVAHHGGVEIVVVNAGIGGTTARLIDSTTADYRRVMAVNLDGAYWTVREAARVMVASGGGGSIIAISSLAAVEGAGHNQPYGAAKAGLLALANGAAVELARHGVRVNTILPGWIATDMSQQMQESTAFTERVINRVPLRRWGRPDDLVGAAVYLASDAARYTTGTELVVDGGYRVF